MTFCSMSGYISWRGWVLILQLYVPHSQASIQNVWTCESVNGVIIVLSPLVCVWSVQVRTFSLATQRCRGAVTRLPTIHSGHSDVIKSNFPNKANTLVGQFLFHCLVPVWKLSSDPRRWVFASGEGVKVSWKPLLPSPALPPPHYDLTSSHMWRIMSSVKNIPTFHEIPDLNADKNVKILSGSETRDELGLDLETRANNVLASDTDSLIKIRGTI